MLRRFASMILVAMLLLPIISLFGCEHVTPEPVDRVVTPNVQRQQDELNGQ